MAVSSNAKVIAFTQAISVCLHTAMMCISYVAFVNGNITIEPLIQSFSINYAAEKILCHLLISYGENLPLNMLLIVSCTVGALGWLILALVLNAYTAVIVFGALVGASQGGLLAVQKSNVFHLIQDRGGSVQTNVQVIKLLSTGITLLLIALPMYLHSFAAAQTTSTQMQTVHIGVVLVGLACILTALSTNRSSILQPIPREAIKSMKVTTQERLVKIYVFGFSFVLAVLSYYDIIVPFLVLYTNHTHVQEYLQLHNKTWIKFDSMMTIFLVVSVFAILVQISELICAVIAQVVSKKQCCVLFYSMTIIKIICVALMPIYSIVLTTIVIAAIMSGSSSLANKIPSFNMQVDGRCLAVSSLILIVLMTAGSHLDNETLSITMTISVSFTALFMALAVMILTLTDMRADTSFVSLMLSQGGCSTITLMPSIVVKAPEPHPLPPVEEDD